jgi:serine/threonine protein kinase
MMEVNLLKNLQHPNVVSYKTSYIIQGMLIIIMEYCEGKRMRMIDIFK